MSSCSSFTSFSYVSVVREELHSSQESVNHAEEPDLDYEKIIAELQAHSKRISEARKAVEGSHSSLEKHVLAVGSNCLFN
jgi:hypothetical protein